MLALQQRSGQLEALMRLIASFRLQAHVQGLAQTVPSVFAAAGCVLAGPRAKHLAVVIIHPRAPGGGGGWRRGKSEVAQARPISGLQGAWLAS